MRVIVLPVCQVELHPHVLLKYDFQINSSSIKSPDVNKSNPSKNAHAQEFYLTPYCSLILSSGSIHTVCEIIKNSIVLRQLFNIQTEDEANLENKIDFKEHGRFIAFGPETDICICALLIPHISSLELNYINQIDPPISRQNSKINYAHSQSHSSNKEKISVERDTVHLWISLNDLCHKSIHIDLILKQPGILSKLSQIDSWAQSYHENTHQSVAKTNIDTSLQLIKARARTLVWDIMEIKNEILYPHPVHGRIPNFRNNPNCSTNLAQLEEFQRARVIEICPSLAQEHLRLFSLYQGKVVLTPAPSIDDAICYKLDPTFLRNHDLARAATKSGAAALGTIINLTAIGNLHVDIFVVASVIVNPISGARLGKGKGYGDIEYAMMHQLGACNDRTLVVTTVHESQLLNDLPASVMTEHDLPVNVIITPKRIIYTNNTFTRPHAINWNDIDTETMLNLPVLKEFKRIQKAI
ncbi:unnamed protein product [Rotaria magnacalcarata]|uniref:5-formyltetrahydrofolate cyclo-ligase n=6 Tax=Rotaria magnacalcarata TaxID=392030 RepID=A0A816VTS0_9BILA|nr:unnamed protein product [Rotaria magnacalcarata]CAF1421449.1 unnamed protein product [Rotaria magnacalcarata]CAF1960012.1 unnamed protein product [Rotaria magnacalcarata]CAF2131823.1 unnamed protein product [Rotaria magnacalcarata]CAF2133211.1 unnamed protein product [Rotaria magnacalcarata]